VTHDRAFIYLSTFNFHGNVTIYSDVALNAMYCVAYVTSRHVSAWRCEVRVIPTTDWFKWNASL